MNQPQPTVASFFAGVGGVDTGFELAGFKTVYANEFDPYAAETFELNFDLQVDRRDIREVQPEDFPDVDVFLAGFPCQAFSISGLRQGFDDEKGRGNLFFEVVRLMKAKQPRIAFFENVKGLVSHDQGNTFKVIREELEALGYTIACKVLNSAQYGNVPQGRERIYIVAFRDVQDAKTFQFPDEAPLTKMVKDLLEDRVDEKYFYTAEKSVFYPLLKEGMKSPNTGYQWRRKYLRENKNNLMPTLTANMGTGGHNVPLVLDKAGQIRKLTPRECFSFQGFPLDYKLPQQSDSRLYKQAGNSVTVPVVQRIAESIMKIIK